MLSSFILPLRYLLCTHFYPNAKYGCFQDGVVFQCRVFCVVQRTHNANGRSMIHCICASGKNIYEFKIEENGDVIFERIDHHLTPNSAFVNVFETLKYIVLSYTRHSETLSPKLYICQCRIWKTKSELKCPILLSLTYTCALYELEVSIQQYNTMLSLLILPL